jgi:hypothetical protein
MKTTLVSKKSEINGRIYHLRGNWSDVAIRSFIAKRGISEAFVTVCERKFDDSRAPMPSTSRVVFL